MTVSNFQKNSASIFMTFLELIIVLETFRVLGENAENALICRTKLTQTSIKAQKHYLKANLYLSKIEKHFKAYLFKNDVMNVKKKFFFAFFQKRSFAFFFYL